MPLVFPLCGTPVSYQENFRIKIHSVRLRNASIPHCSPVWKAWNNDTPLEQRFLSHLSRCGRASLLKCPVLRKAFKRNHFWKARPFPDSEDENTKPWDNTILESFFLGSSLSLSSNPKYITRYSVSHGHIEKERQEAANSCQQAAFCQENSNDYS